MSGRPDRPHREQVNAPEPAPASTTLAPGKMSRERDDLRRILGIDDGRTTRHRDDEFAQQRSKDQILAPGRGDDREAFLSPDQVVVLEVSTV